MIKQKLLSLLKDTFQLEWRGTHGISHWSRVRINGLLIAKQNGANKRVIELFAFLHDIKRENEYTDPEHGKRASQFIQSLSNDLLEITDSEKELLSFACVHHSNSKRIVNDDITILTCWDADRLDLGRIGIKPVPERLNTDIARNPEFLNQAYRRSTRSNKITEYNILKKPW